MTVVDDTAPRGKERRVLKQLSLQLSWDTKYSLENLPRSRIRNNFRGLIANFTVVQKTITYKETLRAFSVN